MPIIIVKFCENNVIIPELKDLGYINDKIIYNVEEIVNYEVICLKIINYKINIYTPFEFLCNLCLNGIFFSHEFLNDENSQTTLNCSNPLELSLNKCSLEKLYKLFFEILEVIILSKLYHD